MKKFNWKTKKFLTALTTVVLLGFGVANPGLLAPLVVEGVCSGVSCDA